MSDFSLSEHLTKFQTSDKKSFPAVANPSHDLNTVIDRLAVSPEQIDADPETLEILLDLSHGFISLPVKLQNQLTYLVASSLSNLCNEINGSLTSSSNNESSGDAMDYNDMLSLIPQWKIHLEEYGYLIHVILTLLYEIMNKIASNSSSTPITRKNVDGNDKVKAELFKKSCNQVEIICESILKVLEINLSRIFQTTPEKDLFISLFLRPLYVLIEIESITKVNSLTMFIQRIICMSVKSHNQASVIQDGIISNLTYFQHLSNFNAKLLTILSTEYNYPMLTEEILKEISSRRFNSKDTTGPKSISNFLVKLSELSPVVMIKQIGVVINLLNNSSITLRCSVVEACGNIIIQLIKEDHYKNQVTVLIDLLEERFQDSNPYVRTKAIQNCTKICQLDIKLNKKKLVFTKLAVRSLQDKSSLVRRNAIKLLSNLLLKHPFNGVHGTQLTLDDWEKHLKAVKNRLENFMASNSKTETSRNTNELPPSKDNESSKGDSDDHDEEMDSDSDGEQELSRMEIETEEVNTTDTNTLLKLKLMTAYYKDAIEFIKDIHQGISIVSTLLFSKNRNEVLEAMDFLILSDAYGLKTSKLGIKKMLHLVWMKGTNDEGTNIPTHLIACYKQLFLTAPDSYNFREKATHIALNLIQLTMDASISDLASLEQLLGMMYERHLIDENIINVLWAIYNSASKQATDTSTGITFTKEQIHGSIIILGMLALENHEIALKGLDSLLNIGLGTIGSQDLKFCRYSCLTLERIVKRKSNSINSPLSLISDKHEAEAIKRLYSMIIGYTNDLEYYPMCEQAISAFFTISSQPDVLASEMIREKTMMTFGKPEYNSTSEDSFHSRDISRSTSLSQLLFIVGQVAIKTLVYLEKCEADFKKRKIEAEILKGREKEQIRNQKEQSNANTSNTLGNETVDRTKDDELAMIGGTNEDDFADAILFIKEDELLNGENSLLGRFCPIVEEIVSNSSRFNDPILMRSASLCLQKLMCISSKYCEKSLPLLITVMEKSSDPIIRSNAVLGLGDMAVCFNNLVDENTDYLYRRLHDSNLMVQRTCLMTVTFLILAGQVKVKGQLSEMAKCLENSDQSISDMCRLFFSELATKDNAIYNGFIDIFSNLSSDESLDKNSFKKILKFLLAFIDKEKYQKQLSDKLVSRLDKCETQKQWDDISFILTSIPYKNEKAATLLAEGFKVVSARE
ncbi:condensin subunit YCS4 NDAI_0I02230 [Naumovozyma dairenensis CBS 421]|uniref:Condensin complex subunit 1 n=1 Tax=Naumovozyma dairenensis (strain ATCC 10597 / BCRC 20456 / CBS 421 / NBRC 0211 / NRRL Y-12639) TaxID=1071378 RepID=G0WG81_NAUDC|nr:hypothetical protein NDAI_0I02230 [Naumovozyma dairenensis CBS 421]CCD26792.1 hypothetical protein NDAI_0I02230 [Naumovozyma dairenensis CBS 421]